jgi:hypothetical protein
LGSPFHSACYEISNIDFILLQKKKSNVDEANKESDGRMMTGQINKKNQIFDYPKERGLCSFPVIIISHHS